MVVVFSNRENYVHEQPNMLKFKFLIIGSSKKKVYLMDINKN